MLMQQYPLLQSKSYVPPIRPEFVSRPRLIEWLNAGLHRKLTLVSAPAGFGKTTLLSDWLRQADRPVAWLSLDEGDNDPMRFLAYLLAALRRMDPEIGQTAETMLKAPQPPPLEPLVASLSNEIAGTKQRFILVLDDYHLIEAAPVHETVSFLLDQKPAPPGGLHLVVATRADPPLPIARLRARGQLNGLHAADLRFTAEEAATFFNREMGLDLSVEDVAALEERTEGWIAGLQMAAVSLRGRADAAAFVRAFAGSHRYIMDYLGDEVLRQQPAQVRQFLLQTAILDRLTAPLCDAVTEGAGLGLEPEGSQAMLEHLESNGLFTIPLDDGRCWYRYHQLFADLLRHRLRQEKPDLVHRLHRRASEWYQAKELYPDAVNHSLAAGDEERAVGLIAWKGWAMLVRGEMRELLGWLDSLPQDLVSSQPQLAVQRAWAQALSGQWDGVEQSLAQIGDGHVPGEVAALQAYMASVQGDVPRTMALCRQAAETLPEGKWFSRSFVALSLGIAHYAGGQPAAAGKALREAIELYRTIGLDYMVQAAMMELGLVLEMAGSLHEAAETFRRALELAPGQDIRPVPIAGMAYVGLAKVHYEWNNLDRALQSARKAVELTELGGFTSTLLSGYARLAEVCLARGDLMAASQALEKADRLVQQRHYPAIAGALAKLRVRSWLVRRDLEAASRWLEDHPPGTGDVPDFAQELEQLAAVRALLALGQPGRALALLRRLQGAAEEAGRVWSLIEILVLQAGALQAEGKDDQALSTLGRALFLAEPEGYVRTFFDEGEPVVRLLRQALTQGIAPHYVSKLLADFGESAQATPPAAQALIEPLTERELEVLHLIATGLSNREIAQELVVAVSTVKTHINHIYGKLDVKSRIKAVTKAQALDLL
jgi:LuxR family maltose regulon positive regulatory protein